MAAIGQNALAYRLAWVVIGFSALAARAYDARDLVFATKGPLPIILTVPHEGIFAVGSVAPRTHGTIEREPGTSLLAQRIAQRLEERTGERPSLVVARFNPKYVDANRAQGEAIESPDALPAYRAYHDRIAQYVEAVRERFPGRGLLLDIHGQDQQPDTVFRGTRDGLTVRALLAAHGGAALEGENSILGRLAAKGYRVEPPPGAPTPKEDPRFSGGYTVFAYGSQNAAGIDAIQLEIGRALRESPQFADDLADAIVGFMETYPTTIRVVKTKPSCEESAHGSTPAGTVHIGCYSEVPGGEFHLRIDLSRLSHMGVGLTTVSRHPFAGECRWSDDRRQLACDKRGASPLAGTVYERRSLDHKLCKAEYECVSGCDGNTPPRTLHSYAWPGCTHGPGPAPAGGTDMLPPSPDR